MTFDGAPLIHHAGVAGGFDDRSVHAVTRTARECERALLAIVGVVDTEFFIGTADRILVGHPNSRVDAPCRAERRSP